MRRGFQFVFPARSCMNREMQRTIVPGIESVKKNDGRNGGRIRFRTMVPAPISPGPNHILPNRRVPAVKPPSITISAPETKLDSSDAR